MKKPLTITILVWLILCIGHYVVQTQYFLSGPRVGDLYAYSWSFQALNFALGYFPFWLLALLLVFTILAIYYQKKAEPGGAPNAHPRHAGMLARFARGIRRATGERG